MRTLFFITSSALAVAASASTTPAEASESLEKSVEKAKEGLKATYKIAEPVAQESADSKKAVLGDELFKSVEEYLKKLAQAEKQIKEDKVAMETLRAQMHRQIPFTSVNEGVNDLAKYDLAGENLLKLSGRLLKSVKQYKTEHEKLVKAIPAEKQESVCGTFNIDLEEGEITTSIRWGSSLHKSIKNMIRDELPQMRAKFAVNEKKLKAAFESATDATIKDTNKKAYDAEVKKNKERLGVLKYAEVIGLKNREEMNKLVPKLSISAQADAHEGKPSKSKTWLIVVGSIVGLMVVGAAVYFFVIKKQ